MTVATDAIAEWRSVTERPPPEALAGAYQVFDYPVVPGATAFLFYWPASLEITFAAYLPQETGASPKRQLAFVTHLSRLLGELGFPVEVHGVKSDHPFAVLPPDPAAARLRVVAAQVARNRGYLLIGLAEDRRAGDDRDADDESPTGADGDAADDEGD